MFSYCAIGEILINKAFIIVFAKALIASRQSFQPAKGDYERTPSPC